MQPETKRVWAGGIAAGLAGLSASESHATIIYTPADINVGQANTMGAIDFEGDGSPAVSIDTDTTNGLTIQKDEAPKAYFVNDGSSDYVAALPQGEEITTSTESTTKLGYYGTKNGELNNGLGSGQFVSSDPLQYIGVEWEDSTGATYYGWIGVEVTEDNLPYPSLLVTGFAYDNTGATIAAGATPEPTSLMLLAMGSAGLLAYRRRAPIVAN